MAPPGKHYMTVYGQWAPYHLKEGNWDSIGDGYVKQCVDLMTEYIPNLKEIIDDYFLVSPKELEDRIFMSQGHMFHGECVPGQVFQLVSLARPIGVTGLSRGGRTTGPRSRACTCVERGRIRGARLPGPRGTMPLTRF